MTVETLITEMQEVKATYDTLTIDQVLKIFEIQAMKDLAKATRNNYGG